MILTIETSAKGSWLVINGTVIPITEAQKEELFQKLYPPTNIQQPEDGYWRYFYS